MTQFPRMSIDLQEEEWSLLQKIPKIMHEEGILDTPRQWKVLEWKNPEELKVKDFVNGHI